MVGRMYFINLYWFYFVVKKLGVEKLFWVMFVLYVYWLECYVLLDER